MDKFPRRRRVDLWSPAELAINNAMQEVEKMGADDLLTKAVVLLSEAQDRVADFVDKEQIISLSMNEVIPERKR